MKAPTSSRSTGAAIVIIGTTAIIAIIGTTTTITTTGERNDIGRTALSFQPVRPSAQVS